MAQIPYQFNLNAKSIPFLSELQGRTVIVGQQDQDYQRLVSPYSDGPDIPQVYYCHNVIPTRAGLESIGYSPIAFPPADSDNTFASTFEIRNASEQKAFFNNTTSGRNYVQLTYLDKWVRTTDVAPIGNKTVTTAHINGESYIYFEKVGCYKYDFPTNALVAVTLTGLTANQVIGITAANGRMIAWTGTALAWSSTIDPTDFTPSLATGAGGGSLQNSKGLIVTCLPHFSGFFAYTTANAVAMIYSGNSQYPFNEREIVNSGGLLSGELVSYDANTGNHYAYTTSGLQLLSQTQAQTVFPEVTDFLAGSLFEDFDDTTLTFTVQTITGVMLKKLTVVSDRYLIISYGVTQLTHALLYDITYDRWTKLKITHVDCFEYTLLTPESVETPRRSIAFVQADGTVQVVSMAYNLINSNGTVLLGKYQFIRNRFVQLHSVALENIRTSSNFSIKNLYTLDGKNFQTADGTLVTANGVFREYKFRVTGLNHSLLCQGGFHLVSGILSFTQNGRR